MDLDLFDYELPESLIAQQPCERRSASRMLVMRRAGALELDDRRFSELPEFIESSDVVVLNDTRVIPARLVGRRPTGGKAEVLLLRREGNGVWEALVRPGAKLGAGERVVFGQGALEAEVIEVKERGLRTVRLHHDGELTELLDELGQTPLPPYIKRERPTRHDRRRYQTIYAERAGAAAAPTAGLHFDEKALQEVRAAAAEVVYVTLHVGLGTFQPVFEETVEAHEMHPEWCEVSKGAAAAINSAVESGGRTIAVGTTVVRTLESRADETGAITPGSGLTDLFIYPGYEFRAVDGLLTNFHLPRSTLLMMVSAFAGRRRILRAYQYAIEERYRFYSYGDCMLIV